MLGTSAHNILTPAAMTQAQTALVSASPYTQPPAPAAVTPSWVPWAIGAAIGGGILYLLVRNDA